MKKILFYRKIRSTILLSCLLVLITLAGFLSPTHSGIGKEIINKILSNKTP
ncbi:MAG: hypothetical protein ABIP40_03550 [Bacteroidia bacterium]